MKSKLLNLPKLTKFDSFLISLNWTNWKFVPYNWKMFYWETLKPIFAPQNKKIRKSVSRNWKDVCSLITDVNFAMIVQFYEDEYKEGLVDWEGTSKDHAEFAKWLEKAYMYITAERKELESKLNDAYPPLRSIDELFVERTDSKGNKTYTFNPHPDKTYDELYGEVHRLEKIIEEKDTELLKNLIDKRHYFWT